jgi:RimJ/RimL family protein N-acetyltransferase
MILAGPHLSLRPLEQGDLETSRAWVNDRETARGLLRVLPVSQLEQQAWYESISRDPTRMVWAVQAGPVHVGNCGLYHIDFLHRRAEAWFLIGDHSRRGQGLGREMASLLLEYAFRDLGLNKVYLHVGADNARARGLYEALGFVCEGVLRQEYFIAGDFRDVLRLSLLGKDWRFKEQDKNLGYGNQP